MGSHDLRLQKRLAASIMGCGKYRVWLDPQERNEIGMANSRANIRTLIRDGFIIKKTMAPASHGRQRRRILEKKKGRHMGPGTRKGTANARTPEKGLWVFRIRVLRRLLRRYREQRKIDKHLHAELYRKAKGNVFKSKRVLIEYIIKAKSEKAKEKALNDQVTAQKTKARLAKEKSAALAAEKTKEKIAAGEAARAKSEKAKAAAKTGKAEKPEKPTAKDTKSDKPAKPSAEKPAKPAAKSTEKPAAKSTEKPAAKVAAKPAKPAANPAKASPKAAAKASPKAAAKK